MVTLTACGSDSPQEGADVGLPDAQQELYDAAVEAGGQVTAFVGTSGNAEQDAIKTAFHEAFPDVTLNIIGGTSDQVVERFMTEKRAGLNNADVLTVAGVGTFEQPIEEGFIQEFTPEDAELFTSDEATYIDGLVYSFSDIQVGACYNTQNVTDEEVELLQDYQGWTDPVWTGRASIVNTQGFGNRRGLMYWVFEDEELGVDWLEGLAALEPMVYSSANTASSRVIAGEHDVVFNALTIQAPRAFREGAPLRCVTGPYAPAYPFGIALPSDAPNEAGGKLFINWIMSEAGQSVVQEALSYNARREGFDEPVIVDEGWNPPDDLRFLDETVAVERGPEMTELFDSIVGTAQE